ncbi:MAG TPA: transposase [Candidatus Hydrogenedentes bacterium]|nr:transposase [Candidatus Hydrogenedentota bacterium]
MAQSLAKNIIHLIYSTKNRTPCLGPECREKLYDYQAGIFDQWESPAILIGGVADHVHTLFVLSKNHRLTRIVEEVKKGSSKWLKTLDRSLASFHWQNGYGAFSVSQSNVVQVRRYIEAQQEHHRKVSFQEEFRVFLKRHGIEYDERYVWD